MHFEFNAENQDGRPKQQKNDFWKKSSDDYVDTLRAKNFAKIALLLTVSEINVFLHFTQKFRMAAKNGGKTILKKVTR